MQAQYGFDRDQQDEHVTDGIKKTAGVEKGWNIDAFAIDRLVPNASPWATLPDLNNGQSKVEQDEHDPEHPEGDVENTPALW